MVYTGDPHSQEMDKKRIGEGKDTKLRTRLKQNIEALRTPDFRWTINKADQANTIQRITYKTK